MKKFYFNVQSKGGAGKSMLTYLQALKFENNTQTAFIDLDSSTKTSSRQLNFLNANETRLFEVDILDEHKKIEREKLFSVLEKAGETGFENIIIDFGAAESEQFVRLLSMDFKMQDFLEFAQFLEAEFVFNVVMAGGPSYIACFSYLKEIVTILDSKMSLYIYANEFTFKNQNLLIEELREFAERSKGAVKAVISFGNFFPERVSGIQIMENIKAGRGHNGIISFVTKVIIRNELAKIL